MGAVKGGGLRIGVWAASFVWNGASATVIWRNGHQFFAAASAAAFLLTLAYWKRLRAYLKG